ncbi:antibiotic biosynthesis monooxygenase [Lactobacillus helveticus]|uniref:putative quinol monooxygenase n=1 Tax=Lactobacillus helveticus TaxID=1587 RepID=UPI001C6493A7|nr:antibiotic biosynthesis monooxygenase [Lactobacillus helveticus]MBW7986503.1 antibiotic biosynthesis monooxygenase [Lactobacillus helveticus]MBW8009504.1 antibiotic biosynthesis monooxygenase [Lactobacillus helveticus]MBW8019517.1 antibiotic biosynthesis monooxygenase [Lactobacillus helveticus]MBW8038023.1 antibiotic biosynthesis monooxygenase [Lactobacillus helveticus]MBW8044046.1 antibiotic biosynthesis monooxygenase [Lactobacillus helveticus]
MKLINAPIMRIFHLNINAPNRTAFVNEGKHNMMTSIKNEPGTLFMLAGHDDKLGESNYVIECYQDEEHYQIHANSPQFKHYGQAAKKIITGTEMINLKPELVKTSTTIFRVFEDQDINAMLTKIKVRKETNFDKLTNSNTEIILAGQDKKNTGEGWVLGLSPSSIAELNLADKAEILDQIKLKVDILVDQGSLSYERSNNND